MSLQQFLHSGRPGWRSLCAIREGISSVGISVARIVSAEGFTHSPRETVWSHGGDFLRHTADLGASRVETTLPWLIYVSLASGETLVSLTC
jgi:hypothetical protein